MILTVALVLAAGLAQSLEAPRCTRMDLPELFIGAPPEAYRVFCREEPEACAMDGEPELVWSGALFDRLARINAQVNSENALASDWEINGVEDSWDLPENCRADCEDFALEKRERLADLGLPRAALRMAIAFHEVEFFPHAVLLVETTAGTWALDNLYDEVMCWDAVPYRYTHRERLDGSWTRFQILSN
ncbi:MAG: transglutaminase-like cysteine peptidase [Paracoccaceae bacterium]|nr:transglutaminase-like cysteine peptidase [Paracoccaceae bacterium]